MNAQQGYNHIKSHIKNIANIAELKGAFNLLYSYKKEFGNCNFYDQLIDELLNKRQKLKPK